METTNKFTCRGCHYENICIHDPEPIGVNKEHPYGIGCKWENKCHQRELEEKDDYHQGGKYDYDDTETIR